MEQAGRQVLFPIDLISTYRTNEVEGRHEANEALEILLAGTGLEAVSSDTGTLTITVVQTELDEEQPMEGRRTGTFGERTGFIAGLVAALVGGAGSTSADAQQTEAAGALEEIIVTARRRTENLQQVPVSVEAFMGDQMALRGMERIENVIAQTPNVFAIGWRTGDSRFAMRGIPDVGFFLDDVWQHSASRLKDRSVLEIDRVEVLRGPQGTLFGRNATGGAIKVYTRRPADEFGMRLTATSGSYDRLDISANVDIPLAENFFTKWTVSRDQRDGYIQSLTVDRAYGEIDDKMLRGDLMWTPTEKLNIRLILEDSLQQTTHTNGSTVIFDPDPPGPSPAFGFAVHPRQYYELLGFQFDNESHVPGWPGGQVGEFETKENFDQDHGVVSMHEAWTLDVQYDISDTLSFRSVTGWREVRNAQISNFDTSEFQMFAQSDVFRDDLVTQEFQFTGGQGRINWVAGAFLWEATNQRRTLRWGHTDIDATDAAIILNSPECQVRIRGFRPCRVPGYRGRDTMEGSSEEGWALFGEVTVDLTDTLSLTAGARQHDQDDATWVEQIAAHAPQLRDLPVETRLEPDGLALASAGITDYQAVSFDADTYRFALTNQFNDDLMAYIGYSEGFNSGGVEQVQFRDLQGNPHVLLLPFDPELIENTEIGVRSDWLDGRLRLNATYFWTDWTNMIGRLQVVNPFTGELEGGGVNANVAESEAEGAEISLVGQFTDRFRFDVGVGILDTAYTKIENNVTGLEPDDKFGQAPELQYNIGAQWDLPVANGGEFGLRFDYSWTDDYIRSHDPQTQLGTWVPSLQFEQESFGLLNARLVYRAPNRDWELAAFGTNLTDEFYMNGGFSPVVIGKDYAQIGRPREAGVTLKVFFD